MTNTISGWDWGPILTTCGPWKEVRLESYQARVEDLRIDYEVSKDLSKVTGTITAAIEGSIGDRVKFSASLEGEKVFDGSASVNDKGEAEVEFHVSNPKLWYPHGYGEQPLYTLSAALSKSDRELHSISKRTGFRKTELVQTPDEVGKTFYFRVNGVDVFCGGSDWIPAESFVSAYQRKFGICNTSLIESFARVDSQDIRRSLSQVAADDGRWLSNHDTYLGWWYLGR